MHGLDFLSIRDCHYNHPETTIVTIKLLSSQICFIIAIATTVTVTVTVPVPVSVTVTVTVTLTVIVTVIKASFNEIVIHLLW